MLSHSGNVKDQISVKRNSSLFLAQYRKQLGTFFKRPPIIKQTIYKTTSPLHGLCFGPFQFKATPYS
jgi:hypothetical protein